MHRWMLLALLALASALQGALLAEQAEASDARPRKHFHLAMEAGTPLGLGFDLAAYLSPRHDIGFGVAGFSFPENDGRSFHPRYRYHAARDRWDVFAELGGVFGSFAQRSSKTRTNTFQVNGADVGMGIDYTTKGALFFEALLTTNIVYLDQRDVETFSGTGTKRETVQLSQWAVLPLIGFGIGIQY